MTRLLLFLVHNWPLKLAALVLATLLYGVIVLTQDSRQFTGPVEVRPNGQTPGLVIVSDLGDVRNIRYFSSEEGVRADSSTFQATVDFAGVQPGTGQRVLRVDVRSIDPRISVLSWEPRQISVTIDELVARRVPVRIEVARPQGVDLDVREAELELETVEVSGASADVARVDHATARIDIDPLGLDVDRDVTLTPVDSQGEAVQQVDVEPSAIGVRIAVFSNSTSRSVPVVPNVVGQPAPGFEIASVTVDPLLVTIEGDDEQLRDVRQAETEQLVITGATGEVSQTVALALPAGIVPRDTSEVRVTVTFRAVTETRSFVAGIRLDGARSDFTYAPSTSSVLVDLYGPTADLDRLEGIPLLVDAAVAGLQPGEQTVPVTLVPPAGVTFVSASPPRVTIVVAAAATPEPASPAPSDGPASSTPSP